MDLKEYMGLPCGSVLKNHPPPSTTTTNAGDSGSVPELGRVPEGGNTNPLHYSCLEIPWIGEAGRKRLSD